MCRYKQTLVIVLALSLGVAGRPEASPREETVLRYPPAGSTVTLDENGIPEGMVIVEGDIQVPAAWLEPGLARGTFSTSFWPDGVVPFEFQSSVNAAEQAVAEAAMDIWESVADVTFRPADFDIAYITFRDSGASGGNNAPVGWFLGFHTVNISNWTQGVVAHELGHVLGFWHEQSRADRNTFVQIEFDNIDQDACGGPCDFNFEIVGGSENYGPYDFGSIMHYSACAFSICSSCSANDPSCRTITVLPPNDVQWQGAIGSNTLSAMDALTMSFMYPQNDWRFVDDDDGTIFPSGSFLDPWVSVADGIGQTPAGGDLWIQPGSYGEVLTLDRAMTIRAPLGGVLIGD